MGVYHAHAYLCLRTRLRHRNRCPCTGWRLCPLFGDLSRCLCDGLCERSDVRFLVIWFNSKVLRAKPKWCKQRWLERWYVHILRLIGGAQWSGVCLWSTAPRGYVSPHSNDFRPKSTRFPAFSRAPKQPEQRWIRMGCPPRTLAQQWRWCDAKSAGTSSTRYASANSTCSRYAKCDPFAQPPD